jgi:hypothetical protein
LGFEVPRQQHYCRIPLQLLALRQPKLELHKEARKAIEGLFWEKSPFAKREDLDAVWFRFPLTFDDIAGVGRRETRNGRSL